MLHQFIKCGILQISNLVHIQVTFLQLLSHIEIP